MKTVPICLVSALILCALPGFAGADSSLAPLTGLTSVRMAVYDEGDSKDAGIDEDHYQTHCELKLRQSSIGVSTDSFPELSIDITTVKADDGRCAIAVNGALSEDVTVPRITGKTILATTWTEGRTIIADSSDVTSSVDRAVDEVMDEFCNDYLKDNPAKSAKLPAATFRHKAVSGKALG